jgi:hypothetical protein
MVKKRVAYEYWVTDIKTKKVLPNRFDIDSIDGAKSILSTQGKDGRKYDIVRRNINNPWGTKVGTYKTNKGRVTKVK